MTTSMTMMPTGSATRPPNKASAAPMTPAPRRRAQRGSRWRERSARRDILCGGRSGLLPEEPRPDLIALAKSQGIEVVSPNGEGGA